MNPFYENKDAPLQISSSLNMEFPNICTATRKSFLSARGVSG